MTFVVGTFDIVAYALPGSLYLGLFMFIVHANNWLDLAAVLEMNAAVLVAVAILLSYLMGHLFYGVARRLNHVIPGPIKHAEDSRRRLLERTPMLRDRAYANGDIHILLAGVQATQQDSALDILRLMAAGLMLRNCVPAFSVAGVISLFYVAAGPHRVFAAFMLAIFMVGAAAALIVGRERLHWASLKILELAFWIPDIDKRFS